MKKNSLYIVFILVVIAILIIGVFLLSKKTQTLTGTTPSQSLPTQSIPTTQSLPTQAIRTQTILPTLDTGNAAEKTNLIKVSSPNPGESVVSPLKIQGQARGTWFFEGSFPIKIVDENGTELGKTTAKAQGEWMTENFVPFSAELIFNAKPNTKGVLILEKDNPSGLPQNANELRIPVDF